MSAHSQIRRNSKFRIGFVDSNQFVVSHRSGFTLTELLVVIAITAVISAVGFLSLGNFRGRQAVQSAVDEMSSVVRATRQRSMAQEGGGRWGMHFVNATTGISSYTTFRGYAFATGTVDRQYPLPSNIFFSNPFASSTYDVVFAPLTGTVLEKKVFSVVSGRGGAPVGDLVVKSNGSAVSRLESGLVGYWHLDENAATTTHDASGNVNTGTLTNGPTWQTGANCRGGSCLSFDGTDRYVNVPNSSNLQVSGDLTIEFWVYPTNLSAGRQGLIYKNYNNEYEVILESSGLVSFYQGNGTWEEIQEPAGFTAPQSTWTHMAITRTASGKTIYFYKNGALVGSDPYVNSPTVSTDPVIIGKRGGTAYYFNGKLDEVRIYNSALSAAEILSQYNDLK